MTFLDGDKIAGGCTAVSGIAIIGGFTAGKGAVA
jgi:hypothetical protein